MYLVCHCDFLYIEHNQCHVDRLVLLLNTRKDTNYVGLGRIQSILESNALRHRHSCLKKYKKYSNRHSMEIHGMSHQFSDDHSEIP